ncbi:MAG: ABC transporter ATP-binding protein [Lachnospiraceae bacterium]|nr:ABC transporter ATP-binding protein [Lachnospiraceae bacterium]
MKCKLNYLTAICFLFRYMQKYLTNFIRFYLGWLFDTVLSIVMPVLFGIMIDQIVYKQNLSLFLKLSGMYVILAIFSCVLYLFIYAQHHYLINMFTLNIKLDIFKHLMKCKAEYLIDMASGDINTLLEHDSSECMHFMIRNVIHQLNHLLSILIILGYLCKIDIRIGLFAMIAAPLSAFLNMKLGKTIRTYGDKARESYGGYISWIFELLSALRDIRVLGARQHVENQFDSYHKNIYGIEKKSGMTTYKAEKLTGFISLTIKLLIFTFAGYLASKEQLTIGVLTIIISFYDSLTNQISRVSSSYLDGLHRISLIQKIYDFLHAPIEDNNTSKKELKITDGNIEFNTLNFAYTKEVPILSDITFQINSGEKVAITGKSGSGKTTLAYLLIGFYQAKSGKLLIDGQNLAECSLKSIRRQIGLIAQDVLIFPGTIRENIMLGNSKATDKEIIEVCKQAELWEVIQALPDGLDTFIGLHGNDLSGGQKQRIAIARIYLKNPKIIIFDEATSALDSKTELEIHNAWNKVLAGRTSIIITHRDTTLMHCDKIVELRKGKLCSQS